MYQFFRLLAGSVAVACAGLLPVAQASTVITFDGAPPNLYLDGEGLSESGFQMMTEYDFGTVDTADALGDAAPTGNATQFYFNSNDGDLLVSREDGGSFSLDGFSAAFIPLIPSSSQAQITGIVAYGVTDSGDHLATYFGFGSSATSHFPFIKFDNSAGDFTHFSQLSRVYFFACALTGTSCDLATQNNGQFAIDDILVTPVPEPSTTVLLALGLMGVMSAASLGSERRRLVGSAGKSLDDQSAPLDHSDHSDHSDRTV